MNRIDKKRQPVSYEKDFALWSAEQAALIRSGKLDQIDIENIAEEVESLAREERRKIDAHLQATLMQMMRWRYQSEYRCGKWESDLLTYRERILDIVETSPSLASYPAEALPDEYRIARQWSSIETTIPFESLPSDCPFSIEQVLDTSFLPD